MDNFSMTDDLLNLIKKQDKAFKSFERKVNKQILKLKEQVKECEKDRKVLTLQVNGMVNHYEKLKNQFDMLNKTVVFLLFFFSVSAPISVHAQTFTFECLCTDAITGDTCDICTPTTNISSRSFNGLMIYRSGIPYKWIDAPYSIRVLPGENVEFLEYGTSNPDRIKINRAQTQFFTVAGYVDSTWCSCNTVTFDGPLFYVSDTENTAPVYQGDTVSIIGTGGSTVTFDSTQQQFTVNSSGSGSCDCCDSLQFFVNDSLAKLDGINPGMFYLTEYSNSYGMAWGLLKSVVEPGPITTVRPPGCIANVPDVPLLYYESDTEAKTTGGLSLGEYYILTIDNLYAMAGGLIKQVTEP